MLSRINSLNVFIFQINTNYALSINPNASTTPFAYFNSNVFCLEHISGSSWSLANLFSSTYETDSTMTVACTTKVSGKRKAGSISEKFVVKNAGTPFGRLTHPEMQNMLKTLKKGEKW